MGCGWSNLRDVQNVYMFRKRGTTYSDKEFPTLHPYEYHHIGKVLSGVHTIGPRRSSNISVSRCRTFQEQTI